MLIEQRDHVRGTLHANVDGAEQRDRLLHVDVILRVDADVGENVVPREFGVLPILHHGEHVKPAVHAAGEAE